MIHLFEVPTAVKFIEAENTMVVARPRGGGKGGVVYWIYSSDLQDRRSLGDWLYKNVNVLNTTELYT
jgi:hypothetical protein